MLEKTDRTVVPPHLRMCRFATQTHELPDGRVEGGSETAKAVAGAGAGAMCKKLPAKNFESALGRAPLAEARLDQLSSMPKFQIWKRPTPKRRVVYLETKQLHRW